MDIFYVYVLRSMKDHKFYIGQTNNIKNRLERHSKGQVASTKHRRPFECVFIEKFDSRQKSMEREHYLKSLKGGNEFQKILAAYTQ